MKKDKKQISEEELAAYIDGRLSQTRSHDLESSLTDDTLELIGVTRAAIEEVPKENIVLFPRWSDLASTVNPFFRQRNPLAMAGFLGDEDEEEAPASPVAKDPKQPEDSQSEDNE